MFTFAAFVGTVAYSSSPVEDRSRASVVVERIPENSSWGVVHHTSSPYWVNSSMLNGVAVLSVVHHPTSALYVYPVGMTGSVGDVDASPAAVAPLSMTYRKYPVFAKSEPLSSPFAPATSRSTVKEMEERSLGTSVLSTATTLSAVMVTDWLSAGVVMMRAL